VDAGSNTKPASPDGGGTTDSGGPDAGDPLTYRNSLSRCWTDPTCNRALTIAHGGDWSFSGPPYASDAALAAAFDKGADGVKIDARMTQDNVAVVAHSSPIETYESLDCANKKIEEMTAAQVTDCHYALSTQKFQRLDTVLDALRGKLVVQICVKLPADTAGIAAAVQAATAEDFAFLEISTSDLQTLIPTIPGADKLWYLINIENRLSEVDTLLDTIKNPRAFMYEFDPDVSVSSLVTTRLHPAGIRSFTYDKGQTLSTSAVKAHFDGGFDVVSTDVTKKAVAARIQVNTERGISPP
jgi:glycerophosphoryl diester phosphodiesterase